MKSWFCFLFGVALAIDGSLHAEPLQVEMRTNQGSFVIELDPERAPETVGNFLQYLNAGFYDDTLFHRLLPNFVLQAGSYTRDMASKPVRAAIRNEANNGLSNLRGTVAMAREREPDSATSQFFINLADNTFLDHREATVEGWGYCVFGRVVSGMETIQRIAAIPVMSGGDFIGDQPLQPVVIEQARLLPARDK